MNRAYNKNNFWRDREHQSLPELNFISKMKTQGIGYLLYLSMVSVESNENQLWRMRTEKEFPETHHISLQDLLAVLQCSSEK